MQKMAIVRFDENVFMSFPYDPLGESEPFTVAEDDTYREMKYSQIKFVEFDGEGSFEKKSFTVLEDDNVTEENLSLLRPNDLYEILGHLIQTEMLP